MDNVFDSDLMNLNVLKRRYLFFFFLCLLIIILMLTLIKKKLVYQNMIDIDANKGVLLVEKHYLEKVKNKNKILLNDISYDYNIEKIEEKDNVYLITISFPYEINLNVNYYQILLEEESIIKYIIRIIKGG